MKECPSVSRCHKFIRPHPELHTRGHQWGKESILCSAS
ncbi:unnamed protein product [Tetraodon nigroviridis]|uniref:Chromosome 16 SCAF14537, whole genome shotgun sequence n=1 Tax=Tetraodon nigroviridis TaxID=99883 RepID=Q4SPP6_TETNG|nr:unnamed protein product [Tetraodon nigroviridis]